MQKGKQLYEGKAKKVFETEDPERLIVSYKDDATAFNGLKKGTIVGKGVINNRMSNLLMGRLENAGIPTHLVEELSERETLVKKVSIVPLEVIVRNIAAGSFSKRYGVEEGVAFDSPTIEFSYKNDELGDPLLDEYHALALKLATPEEIETIKKYSFAVNEELKAFWKECGITLLQHNFASGLELDLRVYLLRGEHFHILFIQQVRHTVGGGAVVAKSSLLRSLGDPRVIISVAVENNSLVILDGLLDQIVKRSLKIGSAFKTVRIALQGLRNRRVEHDVCTSNAVRRAKHTELEFVARECEGGGTVTVGGISVELGKNIYTKLHLRLLCSAIRSIVLNGFQNRIQLVAKEDGNHGGRRFVGAKTVVVACGGNRNSQQILIIVNRLDDGAQKQQELRVFIGGLAGRQKVLSRIGRD